MNLPQDGVLKGVLAGLSLLLFFICFPLIGNIKLPNIYFVIVLAVILLSQLIYLLNIPILKNIFDSIYPITIDRYSIGHMQDSINTSNMFGFRMGGLYHNPNDCARSLTMLLATYLIVNYTKRLKQLLPFVLVSFYAILMTGSRTGFAIASILIIAYLFVNKKISSIWRFIVVVIFMGVFVYLLLSGSNQFRGFNVVQGFSNSADSKFDVFVYYISSEDSIIRFLFGYLDNSRFRSSGILMDYFDSDYGNIVFCYGFVGFFSILIYFYFLSKKMNNYGKIFFVLLLWMISNSIISSFRAGFLFMFLLSIVYHRTKLMDSNSSV